MLTFEEVQSVLNALAEEIPKEIYKNLNGGIILLPIAKPHPEARDHDLYIEGEYHKEPRGMGRYITLYYGSLQYTAAHLTDEAFCARLKGILYHELTHHIEDLCGERGLLKKDAAFMAQYKRKLRRE